MLVCKVAATAKRKCSSVADGALRSGSADASSAAACSEWCGSEAQRRGYTLGFCCAFKSALLQRNRQCTLSDDGDVRDEREIVLFNECECSHLPLLAGA